MPTGPYFHCCAVDLLGDSGLELGEVGFASLQFEVMVNGTLEVPDSLGDRKWGLIWLPLTVDPQLLEGFVVL